MSELLSNSAISGSLSTAENVWREFQAQNEEILARLRALQGNSTLPNKDFYSVEEVAQYVHRSPYTVRKWILDGKMKAVRVAGSNSHGRKLIPHAELSRLFE
jgi:excisionase family DNA binding protein